MKLRELKAKNVLGCVVGLSLVVLFVLMGLAHIKTDGQMEVILAGIVTLILLMGTTVGYMRSNRYTMREMWRVKSLYYFHISFVEQKLLQMSVIMSVSGIILVAIKKAPKVWMLIMAHLN